MSPYKIALVPGDGIGKEIIPEGVRVLQRAGELFGFQLEFREYPWGASYYMETGEFMPGDGIEELGRHDAIYFGAIGRPDVDDTLPAAKYTFKVRKSFQQYVNYRPVVTVPGVRCPLAGKKPGDIDFIILRENTEGEFAQVGNQVNPRSSDGFALETSVFTRRNIERFAHFAFRLARKRRRLLTNVTKSNTLIHTMKFWDDVFEEIAGQYADVEYQKMYVDATAANFVLRPERFDVVASTNMIGDILSDLGGALMGSLGLGPSANLNPEHEYPSMFEPIHGSAPDIAGRGIANPIGTIWSGALLLEHLGQNEAAQAIVNGIYRVLDKKILPADLGGDRSTRQMGDAVIEHLNA